MGGGSVHDYNTDFFHNNTNHTNTNVHNTNNNVHNHNHYTNDFNSNVIKQESGNPFDNDPADIEEKNNLNMVNNEPFDNMNNNYNNYNNNAEEVEDNLQDHQYLDKQIGNDKTQTIYNDKDNYELKTEINNDLNDFGINQNNQVGLGLGLTGEDIDESPGITKNQVNQVLNPESGSTENMMEKPNNNNFNNYFGITYYI